MHTLNPGCPPTARALRLGLCACSVCCVPAQSAVCLLSLLCACSAFCVPAQPAVCHNKTEPAVCLLSLLYATIQLSLLCVCSGCCVLAQPAVCLLRLLCACSGCCMPAAPLSRYNRLYRDMLQRPGCSPVTIQSIVS